MKSLLVVIALFGVAFCAPEGEVPSAVSDEAALADIEEVVNYLTKSLDFGINFKKNPKNYFKGYVLKAVRHIDRQCILKSLKKYDSVDKIPAKKFGKNLNGRPRELAFLSFVATLGSCYRKGDVILDYIFESWMTNGIIIRAFINEKAFSKFADTIACVNSYAIKNKFWDPEIYGFTPKPVDDEDLCDEMTAAGEMIWVKESRNFYYQFAGLHNKSCFRGLAQQVKAFVVKYVTLVQLDLNYVQMNVEKKSFIKDVYDFFEGIKKCAAIPAPVKHLN